MKYCFFLIIVSVACHSLSSTSSVDSLKSAKDSPEVKTVPVIEPDSAPNTFRIHFPLQSVEVAFNSALDSPQRRQTYIFYAKKGQSLDAEITPDTTMANIRFNQIFSPGGSADGPFGLTIHYALNETGDYKLIIAESLMGEPWTGKFLVHVKIK